MVDPTSKGQRFSVIGIACPQCEAAVGERCISVTGKPAHHRSRRLKAFRLLGSES